MKKILSTLAVATALTTSANAGLILDAKVGGGSMVDVAPTGSLGYLGNNYGITNQLGIDNSAQTYLYVEFEHLVPIIPNVKIEQNTLSFTGTATANVTLPGISITGSTPSTYSWDHQDAIFYWGVPFSTWIPMIDAADFGFGLKLGDMSVGATGLSSATFDFGAVYGYGRLHVSPPFLFGLGFELEVKALELDDVVGITVNYRETTFKTDWLIEAPIPVIDLAIGVEAGYKAINYVGDAAGMTFDIGYSSLFFGAVAKFGI